jgi:hypothetical protein
MSLLKYANDRFPNIITIQDLRLKSMVPQIKEKPSRRRTLEKVDEIVAIKAPPQATHATTGLARPPAFQ